MDADASATLPVAVAPVVGDVASASWAAAQPVVSVVVATHQRASFLDELVAALAAQESAPDYDVILVDDASSDSTWTRLSDLVRCAEWPLRAVRLGTGAGPSLARNTGVAHARGRWVAFTDDDCLPEPRWLTELVKSGEGVAIVQGSTSPVPGPRPGPWARSIDIRSPTALYETCNL
ncbi:MAG: glycosyltransferase family 2 protein, partial [Actinomycetes bacterium]